MTFLNPLALLGLFAVAIPLLIHLFNFRKPREVNFSSLTFLRELNKTAMKRVRIKQWLLLALRILALASLSLVFARPTVQSRLATLIGGDGSSAVGLIVDNSRSMSLRGSRGEYFENAKAVAHELLESLEASDEFMMMTTNGESSVSPGVFDNPSSAHLAVDEIQIADGLPNLHGAISQTVERLEESGKPNMELYILTDGQSSSLPDTTSVETDAGINVFVSPLRSEAINNVGISAVQVGSEIVEPGRPLRLVAKLTNYGDEDYDSYGSSVFVDGKRVAQASAALPAGQTVEAEFAFTPQSAGWLSGYVELESDVYEPDNVFNFSVFIPDTYRILIVGGDGADASYVETSLRAREDASFDIAQVQEQRLAASNLSVYEAVILVGVATLSSGEVDNLSGFVRQGGGLLVFPGGNSVLEDYNALFSALGGGSLNPFIGTEGAKAITRVESVELDHALFSGIFETADGPLRVERPEVYRTADYVPRAATEQTLARFGNGKPFIQEIRAGNGAMLFCAVAPDPTWSELPLRGLFVPLVNRSIYYLATSVRQVDASLRAGVEGRLALAGNLSPGSARVLSPSGIEYFPEVRRTFGGVTLEFGSGFDETGHFDVFSGDELIQQFNVNFPTEESDLGIYNNEELQKVISSVTNGEVTLLDIGRIGESDLAETIQTARSGVELWYAFLLISFILLLLEMLVAKAWRPEGMPSTA